MGKPYIPSPELKQLQRRINRRVLAHLRTHPAAMGFERGTSIIHNAAPYVGMAVVIRMDLLDFFSSTHADRVERCFRRIGWKKDAASLLRRPTAHEGGLPQGAPASPRLGNLVNRPMDSRIEKFVASRRGVYTRYAQMTSRSASRRITHRRCEACSKSFGEWCEPSAKRLHYRGKLRILRRHQQKRVCGLVVNEKVQLPRSRRRWLRAVEHRMATRGEATIVPQLGGWRALQSMIQEQSYPPTYPNKNQIAY